MIPVYENYKDYRPPRYVRSTVANLLSRLPEQYVSGLQSVVLTNAQAIGSGKTGRAAGKRNLRNQCLGFYHGKRAGELPWVEIVVDNIIAAYFRPPLPGVLWYVPVLRDIPLADTLFHEIGHHLERTVGAPTRGGEVAAEAWNKKLSQFYFRKYHWYLILLLRPVRAVFSALVRGREKEKT